MWQYLLLWFVPVVLIDNTGIVIAAAAAAAAATMVHVYGNRVLSSNRLTGTLPASWVSMAALTRL